VRAQVPFLLYNVMFTALPIVIFGVVDQVSQPVRRSGAACRGWLHHNGDWFAARRSLVKDTLLSVSYSH
jgi:hypothetical protein